MKTWMSCKIKIIKSICNLILFFYVISSQALTPGAAKLVILETQFNAAAKRSLDAVKIPHYEIPINWINHDFAERMEPKIKESLIFKKDGQTYFRWILNPEDTEWGPKVELHFFENYNYKLDKKYHFIGFQTASRSYIVEDPTSKVQFSVKASTNITGGQWKNKKQPVGEAIDSRLISDLLVSQNDLRPFKNFIFLDEPGILSIPILDQAVVIRDLKELKNSDAKFFYVPGFSLLHEEYGEELAKRNNSNDPYKYWTEHYIRPVGRALGELAARTGLQFDSPHSQNFLVEFDINFKPTGRVVLRDMADFYVDVNFINAIEGENSEFLKRFTQKYNLNEYIQSGFGPLHGNTYPSWVTSTQYSVWKDVFYQEFSNSFNEVSGYDPEQAMKTKPIQSGDYFLAEIDLKNKVGDRFFEKLKLYKHFPSYSYYCAHIFN